MSLVLRLKSLNKPPRPNAVDVIPLSPNYEFASAARIIDEAVAQEREFVVRTESGKLQLVDPSMMQLIAIREEVSCP